MSHERPDADPAVPGHRIVRLLGQGYGFTHTYIGEHDGIAAYTVGQRRGLWGRRLHELGDEAIEPMRDLVLEAEAVPGEAADASKLLFVVADTSMMWLNLSLRAEDARLVKVGDAIHFRPDGTVAATIPWYNPRAAVMTWLQTIDGTVSWISTAVDEKTRTVRVRADLANSDGKLRAGIFGTGRIVLRQEKTVVVPRDALQHEGCCNIVFVQDKDFARPNSPKVYHVRKVVPGAANDQSVEITAGLLAGESVVFKGASILRGELLKNDMGAGCGCGH